MNLAWIDLETTGTDEEAGSILEIGLTVTDTELHPLDGWETLVVPDIVHVAEMPEKVREMHTRSGLLDEDRWFCRRRRSSWASILARALSRACSIKP